ncbi:hypothetical protein Scep_022414 [Stephania cephalantha]|uniref:Uncharacterized protein n=1 Tax=Stephania cephalantha TaxID=152367 RepID=A0AAP0I285_9MAGN
MREETAVTAAVSGERTGGSERREESAVRGERSRRGVTGVRSGGSEREVTAGVRGDYRSG